MKYQHINYKTDLTDAKEYNSGLIDDGVIGATQDLMTSKLRKYLSSYVDRYIDNHGMEESIGTTNNTCFRFERKFCVYKKDKETTESIIVLHNIITALYICNMITNAIKSGIESYTKRIDAGTYSLEGVEEVIDQCLVGQWYNTNYNNNPYKNQMQFCKVSYTKRHESKNIGQYITAYGLCGIIYGNTPLYLFECIHPNKFFYLYGNMPYDPSDTNIGRGKNAKFIE